MGFRLLGYYFARVISAPKPVSVYTPPMGITDLLLLGQERDLKSERGVSCDGALPAASDPDLVARAVAAKASLGSRAMILAITINAMR